MLAERWRTRRRAAVLAVRYRTPPSVGARVLFTQAEALHETFGLTPA
jgi:hypothetical protein